MAKTIKKAGRKKTKKYLIELTPFYAMLWGVLLFFILTWIFVLGIMVGRGFLPSSVTTIADLRGQIKKLQDIVSSKDTYDSQSLNNPENTPELAFFKELETKKDEVKKNRKPNNASDNRKKENPWGRGTNEILPGNNKEEKKVVPVKPPSLPPEMQYTVQIASVGELDGAEKMIGELVGKGYDAYYYEADVKGKTYYRIRCGRFRTRKEALDYARKLESQEGLKGFVSRIE